MREIAVRKSYEKEGFTRPVFDYRPDWPYISVGFGDEREYFIENLSLLISSGMGISDALRGMCASAKSWKMKKISKAIQAMTDAGIPLWQSLETTRFLPERIISLIRSGEEAGRLADHLNLVTVQRHKEKVLRSRIRSALLYPGIVLSLACVVAIGGAWFILPRIASLFSDSRAELPWATKALLSVAAFFSSYGSLVVPVFAVVAGLLVYLLFFNRKTKFVGDAVLFFIPGVNDLVRGVELARFGYTFGTLLQAGFQVNDALESVKRGCTYRSYRWFYGYLQDGVGRGDSFKEMLGQVSSAERFLPIPIQQLIISAEKSGRLAETLVRVGIIFEEKTDAMSRDLATVLEPIVLIVVGLIVGFVVIAIMGPLYDIAGQIG